MNRAVLFVCLITSCLGGCSWLPRAGPSASEIVEQNRSGGEILFDVVEVDDHVVSTLAAQPKESFAVRFKQDTQPPEVKIAIGDTISVLIWESAAGGLFTEAPPALPSTRAAPGVEPLAPESQPPGIERQQEFGAPPESQPPGVERQQEFGAPPGARPRGGGNPPGPLPSLEAAGAVAAAREAVRLPDQQVESDGAISVPYAGRIPAAGRLPAEVQKTIEDRLAGRALQPQALVIVEKSTANAVTVLLNETGGGRPGGLGAASSPAAAAAPGVTPAPAAPGTVAPAAAAPGTAALAAATARAGSTRVPLSPGGDRLLQVMAMAGGAQAPVHEVFVRLSRDGVTATIPLRQLVSDPAENIYARPGDVLTLIRVPQTFSRLRSDRPECRNPL